MRFSLDKSLQIKAHLLQIKAHLLQIKAHLLQIKAPAAAGPLMKVSVLVTGEDLCRISPKRTHSIVREHILQFGLGNRRGPLPY